VDELDRFIRGPEGQMREIASREFRTLLAKYPATALFSKLTSIFTRDWYMFQRTDMEEANVVETVWLKVGNIPLFIIHL